MAPDGGVTSGNGLRVQGSVAVFEEGLHVAKFLLVGDTESPVFESGVDANNRSKVVFSGQSSSTGK